MLKDKIAVITGSTSGIGLGIARGLANAGAHIVLNGFGDHAEIERTRAEIEAASGSQVIYHGADMSKPAEIAAMIKETHERLGSVDIVVNNAGIQKVALSRNSLWISGMRSSPSTFLLPSIPSAPRSP